MPTLVIQIPDMPPVEHVLKDEAMTIGRMKGNSIALDHSSVSLSHAKLTRIGGDYYLKDLNSTNGTMLNGQTIAEAKLRDGDHVKFGEVAGRYHMTAATLPAQPGPDTPAPGSAPTPASAVPPALAPAFSSKAVAPEPASPPPPPPPPPAPAMPPGLAAFMSKTAPSAPPPPAASAPGKASRPQGGFATAPSTPAKTEQFKKKKASAPLPKFLIPVIAGVAGLILIGGLVWKFALSNSTPPDLKPTATTAQTTAKPLPPVVPAQVIPPPDREPGTVPVVATAPAPTDQTPLAPAAPPDVPTLVQSLKSTDTAERQKAAATLNSMGAAAQDAVPALRDALNDSDPVVRQWSALALIHNKVYDKGTVPILIDLLHHENPIMRQVACLSLALIPFEDSEKPPVVAALSQTLSQDSNGDVKNAAASALKAIIPDTAPTPADANAAQK